MNEIPINIIEACQQGQTAKFAEVVTRYERPLLAYVTRLNCVPSGRASDDVVQEIFLKAYTELDRFQCQAGGRFSAWLFTIARNHCVSLARRKQLENRYLEQAPPMFVSQEHQTSSPDILAQNQEALQRVAQCLDTLSEPLRSAFLLRFYEDMRYADIGQVLNCNEQTARTRVARAKKALALALNPNTPPSLRSDHHAT